MDYDVSLVSPMCTALTNRDRETKRHLSFNDTGILLAFVTSLDEKELSHHLNPTTLALY